MILRGPCPASRGGYREGKRAAEAGLTGAVKGSRNEELKTEGAGKGVVEGIWV